jgi:tetratricopeptide (TPR) repeat protein
VAEPTGGDDRREGGRAGDGGGGEDWSARIEELLAEAEAAPTTADRAAVLCRVAEVYERRLGDANAALVTLQAALEQDPTSGRVVQEMERVARANDCWSALVAVTAEVAAGLADRKQAADLWVQIGFWNESGIGQLDDAAAAAGAALELAPDHGGAFALLEDIYRRQRSWDPYVDILARKRELPGDDPYKLADAYREVLRYEPKHPGALSGLAALHEELAEWERAAEMLRRLVAVLGPGEALLAARYRLGRILKDRLADPRGAEEQLVESLAMPGGEGHAPSMIALAGIYRERKDWLKARQLLGRAAATVEDPNVRVRLLVEAAEICAAELDDEAQASALYDEAIAIDPTRTDVVDKLAAIRFRRGDWAGLLPLADFLVSKAEGPGATAAPPPAPVEPAPAISAEVAGAAPAAADTAAIADGAPAPAADVEPAPGDAVPAVAADVTAGAPPADTSTAAVAEPAPPALAPTPPPASEPAPEAANKPPAAERARLWYQLARACEETGDVARARHAYRSSLALEATGAAASAVQRDFAAFSFRLEHWADAAAAYEALLGAHAASLRRNETTDAYERLGMAHLRAGAPGRALAPLEKALAFEPRRRHVLEALLEAAKAAGDDDAIVRHTQAMLAVTEDRAAKRELLETVATIHRDRRHDPQRAIAAYRAALEAWPDERSIMHRLLELLTETKQWRASVQLLLRLAELTEPEHRNPYFVAAGNILSEELHAVPEAIDVFEQALDADPNDLKSFERVDKLVTAARDWKTQARSYRRQIKRMGTEVAPDKRAPLLALWQGLGEIYRTRLKDYPSAIAAFEVAAGLDPESIERRQILAELYRLAGPEAYPKAVAEQRAILQRAATAADMAGSLKIMLRLYVEMGALDEAHAVAAVLALAGRADTDERALYEQYRPRGVVRAHGRLTEDLWQRLLYHPDEDKGLSQMLATLSPIVALARAKAPKDLGLKRKQQRDINTDPSVVCKAFVYGSAVFGQPPPEIYFAPEAPGEIEVANVRGTMSGMPALVVGKRLLDNGSDLELAFVVGRTLAAVRADHLLRWPTFVPTLLELEIALRAAIRLIEPARPIPADITGEVEAYAGFLGKLVPPQMLEQLSALERRFHAAHPAGDGDALRAELARWARAACLTTIRAGLLLAGDLEVAARLGEATAAAGGMDPADVVRDLSTFGVSDAYFELRAALGLRTVNVGFRG